MRYILYVWNGKTVSYDKNTEVKKMFEDIEKRLDKGNEALALRIAIVDNCIAMNEDIDIEDFCNYVDTNIVQLNEMIEMYDYYCENYLKSYLEDRGVENE